MPPAHGELDDLEQIYELNRLFLSYLKDQADRGLDCLGLPSQAQGILKRCGEDELDGVAEFPRALFDLELCDGPSQTRFEPRDRTSGQAQQALQLTILVTIWNFCRRSAYCARAFFGLSADMVRELRETPLSDLPDFAVGNNLVTCAFTESSWLWDKLLTANDPDFRRQLILVALQPSSPVPPARRSRHVKRTA